MAVKITIFFSQFGRGWTETWYTSQSSLPGSVIQADQLCLGASIQLRSLGTVISAIRYTTEAAVPQSITFPLGDTYVAKPTYNFDPTDPDMVTTTAVYRFYQTSVARKRVFFRGLEDVDTRRDGVNGADIVSPTIDKAVKNFSTFAMAAGWAIRVQQNPNNSALNYQAVTTIAADPANDSHSIITFKGAQPFTAPPASFVRFARVPHNDLPGFPKSTEVLDIGAGPTITIAYRLRGGGSYSPKKMKLIPRLYNYNAWLQVIFERYSEHKTGRPFGLLRGRSTSLVRAV